MSSTANSPTREYAVTRRGTHRVSIEEINQDVPSPGEVVMACAASLEPEADIYWIPEDEQRRQNRDILANALRAARRQGWRFRRLRPANPVQAIPASLRARLSEPSQRRLEGYLQKSAADRDVGDRLSRELERSRAPLPAYTERELRDISANLDRAAEAHARRDRRAARKLENTRRAHAGKRTP